MCWKRRSVHNDVISRSSGVVIDIKFLLKIFDDDKEFVESLVSDGLTVFASSSKRLSSSLASWNFDEIGEVAHTLSGCSANLTCVRLKSASSDLEKYMQGGEKNPSRVEQKVHLVLEEIKSVEDYTSSHPFKH